MRVVLSFKDRSFADFARRIGDMGERGSAVMADALNEAGAATRASTVKAETAQTGLRFGVLDRAQQELTATPGRLSFTIVSRGGNVRLKFFNAKEEGRGVEADPWGRPTFVAGDWIMGGRPGARVPLRFGGEVKRRVGRARLPTQTVRSGLFIPTEMTRGETLAAFEARVAPMAAAIVSRLGSFLP